MPRQATRQQYNTFVGGYHTEANPLTFPPNTAKDLDNVDLLRNGSIKRRRALKLEDDFSVSAATISNQDTVAITLHEWTSVAGEDDQNFLVVQLGGTLYFHQLGASVMADALVGTLSLSSISLDSDYILEPISAASGKDRLFIVSKKIEPAYIEYDPNTDTFSLTQLNLKIRDFEGIEDNLDIDERPTSLSNEHLYNLMNQGWKNPTHLANNTSQYEADVLAYTPDAGNSRYFGNLITVTRNETGRYPSNSDIWYFAKSNAASRPVAIGAYDPDLLHKYSFGNTRAPQGHFILDAFDRNRTTASGVSGLYDTDRDLDTTRPISVEFYAGRVWYLMQNGRLLYSQVIDNIADAEKCYQEADPTAEDINELVATDGGELDIIGINRGVKLLAVGPNLLIFAKNGVWSVSGAEQSVFSATSQYTSKITYVGAVGADSVIPVEDTAFYWADGGIYTLGRDQVSGALVPQNLSEQTIQTFFEGLGIVTRNLARGKYDRREKKIFWLYCDDDNYDGTSNRYFYNKALIFDLVLQSFYKYSLPYVSNQPYVCGFFEKEAYSFADSTEVVTAGGATVTAGGEDVTSVVTTQSAGTEVKLQLFVMGDTTSPITLSLEPGDGTTLQFSGWNIALFGYSDTGVNPNNGRFATSEYGSDGTILDNPTVNGVGDAVRIIEMGIGVDNGSFVSYIQLVLEGTLTQNHFDTFTVEWNQQGNQTHVLSSASADSFDDAYGNDTEWVWYVPLHQQWSPAVDPDPDDANYIYTISFEW